MPLLVSSLSAPDTQIHVLSTTMTPADCKNINLKCEENKILHTARAGVALLPTLLHPKSVGSISLKSADPFDHPVIKTNYLSDPEGTDVKVLVEAIKKVVDIAHNGPVRQ